MLSPFCITDKECKMKFKTLIQHQDYFRNELICMEYFEKERWNGTPACPHCGSGKHYRTKTRFKHPDLKDYKDFVCNNTTCKKKYTTITGTIYESSKVGMRYWFMAAFLLATRKKGTPALQIARDIGVTAKTAWFMIHRIRAAVEDSSPAEFEGTVCADETFVGGKNKNRHADKKVKNSQGRAFIDKTPVAGVMQVNEYESKLNKETREIKRIVVKPSQVRCKVVPDTKANSIQPFIKEHVKKGSVFITDEWLAYQGLNRYYDHKVVDHGRKQYVTEAGDTSNAIENFWSQMKRGLIGVYHQVSRKHLQRYANEFSYRHNTRTITDSERFVNLIKRSGHVRLKYADLVK